MRLISSRRFSHCSVVVTLAPSFMTIGSGSSARTGNSLTPGIFPRSVLISGMGISFGFGPKAGGAICADAVVAAIAIAAVMSAAWQADALGSRIIGFYYELERETVTRLAGAGARAGRFWPSAARFATRAPSRHQRSPPPR